MIKKLYKIRAEYLYGSDSDAKRQLQLEAVSRHGVNESDGEVICELEQAVALILDGYCGSYVGESLAQVLKFATSIKAGPSVEDLFSQMADKLANAQAGQFNHRCNCEQPNLALQSVTETLLLEDCCTDNLQMHLSKGWRIIAVQPQPDQRRPDYILGRSAASAFRG